MNMKNLVAVLMALISLSLFAAEWKGAQVLTAGNRVVQSGWINVNESTYLSGRPLSAEDLNLRIVVVHRWSISSPEEGAKAFQALAKKYADTDFVFLTSYYPQGADSYADVDAAFKRLKISTPVYLCADSAKVATSREPHDLYVVSGGTDEKWFLSHNNTDVAALERYLREHKGELIEESLKMAAKAAPGRALAQYKKLKKSNAKLAARLKPIVVPLNTPENRQMMVFEERVAAFVAKMPVDPRAAQELRDRIFDFVIQASDVAREEGLMLISVLAPLTCVR